MLHGDVADTSTNLKDAAAGEHYEYSDMYAKFATEAREEGFDEIARLLKKSVKLRINTKNAILKCSTILKKVLSLRVMV